MRILGRLLIVNVGSLAIFVMVHWCLFELCMLEAGARNASVSVASEICDRCSRDGSSRQRDHSDILLNAITDRVYSATITEALQALHKTD